MLNPQLLKKIREDPGGLVGSIEHLDLSSGNLGPTDVFQLTKALNAHTSHCGGVGSPIIGINLRNNNLCGLNPEESDGEPSPAEYKGLQSFCRSLATNRYIRVLNISENLLGAPGFKALFDVLEATSSLHELILSGCETTPQIMKDMATALTKNKSVTHLDLSETSMCSEGVEYLLAALCDTYRSEVKTLLLGGNNLGVAGAKKIAKALIRPPRALVALNLESNGFGNEGASRICHALRSNKSIQHLDLSDNSIYPDAGPSLAQALSKNGTLIFLSISWNRLGVSGLLDLVPGLQSNTTLKYLNIIGNGGMPETGTVLIEASLLANSSPVDIDIDHLPTRSRQEILSTDTKAVVAEDAEDDGGEIEANDSPRRLSTPKVQLNA